MKKAPVGLLVALILIPLSLWGAVMLFGDNVMNYLLRPGHPQHDDPVTVPPDYGDDHYWASLPDSKGLANLVPEGQQSTAGPAEVAVFYVHPTSYLSGKRWNAPLFDDSWAWEMVDRMMATQASAFNACCDVYAPHYREATLWSFIGRDSEDGLRALELAYMDVARAFDEFIERFSDERPFIIASHSQGTAHALRLLSHKVNDTPLRQRLVGAYLIGYFLPMDVFEQALTNLPPCESAVDTGCVIHWATYGDDGEPEPGPPHWYTDGWEYPDDKDFLCINPLSWRRDEELAPATTHPGALWTPPAYSLRNILTNAPTDERITELPAVMPGWTWAQCRDGVLFVEPQLDGPFASERDDETQNYHTRDYALFYQAIRENAVLRSRAMLVGVAPD